MKLEGLWDDDVKKFQADIEARLGNVGRELGRQAATKAAHLVRKRLKGSGWIRIYRNAIMFQETPDGTEWAIAGLSEEKNLSTFPAKTSLASFTPTGAGRWPSEYNPWPIDMIPPAHYRGTSIIVRNASESSVEDYRGARSQNLPTLTKILNENGIRIIENGFPTTDGNVFADIAYLARRLELGYPGFARIPHWGPAAAATKASIGKWLAEPKLLRLVDDAIKGATPGDVPQMSQAEASGLARLREATWS